MGPMLSMIPGASSAGTTMLGFGVASVIVLPIMFAIMGFIGGAIGAFIYNIVAKYVGGLQLDLK